MSRTPDRPAWIYRLILTGIPALALAAASAAAFPRIQALGTGLAALAAWIAVLSAAGAMARSLWLGTGAPLPPRGSR